MKTATFKEINITYLALLMGQVVIGGVVVFLISNGNPVDGEGTAPYPLGTLVPFVTLGGLGVAYFLDNQRKNQAARFNFDLPRKINHYKVSVLLRSAIIEGVNMVAAIAALVGGNINLLLYFALGMLVFLYYRPGKGKFMLRYKVSAAEVAQLS